MHWDRLFFFLAGAITVYVSAWYQRRVRERVCRLPEASAQQLEYDLLFLGTSYKHLCYCGKWHRIPPESVVIEYRR